jgi:TPR repeat protein
MRPSTALLFLGFAMTGAACAGSGTSLSKPEPAKDDPAQGVAGDHRLEAFEPLKPRADIQQVGEVDPLEFRQGQIQDCEAGNPDACVNASMLLLGIDGLAADREQASGFAARACKLGEGIGCVNQAFIIVTGPRMQTERELSVSLLESGCKAGVLLACENLGNLLLMTSVNTGDERELPRVRKLLTRACQLGCSASTRDNLGKLLLMGAGGPKDPHLGCHEIHRACMGGHAVACRDHAACEMKGVLGMPDHVNFLIYIQRACLLGDEVACKHSELGRLKWKDECEQGKPNGRIALGIVQSMSKVGPPDYDKGKALFEKACDKGGGFGCMAVVNGMFHGPADQVDHAAIRGLLQRGCDLKESKSCRGLAHSLLSDRGGEPDPKKGLGILASLCEAGAAQACSEIGLYVYKLKDFKTARKAFDKGCQLGHADSCRKLGVALFKGDLGQKNPKQAFAHFKRACLLGNVEACKSAAGNMVKEAPETVDMGEVIDLAIVMCSYGNAQACAEAGRHLLFVQDTRIDVSLGSQLYERACQTGEDTGCFLSMAGNLLSERANKNTELAIAEFDGLCKKGLALACYSWGMLGTLHKSKANHEDLAGAVSKACEQGLAQACVARTSVHGTWEIPELKPDEALALNKRACELGHGAGCRNVAMGQARGDSAERFASLHTLARGCRHKDSKSCLGLAQRYAKGDDAPEADTKARALLRVACEQGLAEGCFHLGVFLEEGRGGEVDENLAKILRQRACRAGYEAACSK